MDQTLAQILEELFAAHQEKTRLEQENAALRQQFQQLQRAQAEAAPSPAKDSA